MAQDQSISTSTVVFLVSLYCPLKYQAAQMYTNKVKNLENHPCAPCELGKVSSVFIDCRALEKWPYQLVAVFQLQEVILARKIVLTAAADQARIPHEV